RGAPEAARPRAHRGLGRRVHRADGGDPRRLGALRPRPRRRVGEAVGRERDVGALAEPAVHAAARRGGGRLLRAVLPRLPLSPPSVAGAAGFFAPSCRAYMARPGCPPHIGPPVAVNARDNAGRNEYAHLREPITFDDVMNSPVLWDPIRYLETCPSSDGAVA